MVTPGCCCWYLAKATEKNGASNVDPAPVRVGAWPPGRWPRPPPDAAVSGLAALDVLVQAAGEQRDRRGGGPDGWMCWPAGPGAGPCGGALTWGAPLREEREAVQRGRVWRTQAWAAIWTASQGLPSGGV